MLKHENVLSKFNIALKVVNRFHESIIYSHRCVCIISYCCILVLIDNCIYVDCSLCKLM